MSEAFTFAFTLVYIVKAWQQ